MKRKRRFILFTIIALGFLAVIGGVLEGASANTIPRVYLPYTWPTLAIVGLVTIGFLFWQFRLQEESEQLPLNVQNRLRMIEKVRAFWIKGVLEQSLHSTALIELGLHEQPNAVANPWHLVLQQPDQSSHPLPAGTRITQVYDDAGGELLILGELGSGKTTLLLELARDLLDRACKDDKLQIPTVFNLSSWAVKRLPLTDWLVDELNTKYQVPRKLGQSWVEGDQIQPLLDGLDEVKSEHREDCIKAINTFRKEHGIVPTVVCSRTTEYSGQKNRILLQNAVVVQPLTEQQIAHYLASGGPQLASVRIALGNDPVSQELVTTPLMLTILTIAYYGTLVEDLLVRGSPEAQRKQIFETYVYHMFRRRSQEKHYTSYQTIRWLIWLAKQMVNREQTVFHAGLLPLSWFSASSIYRFYQSVAAALTFGVWYYFLSANFLENHLAIIIASLLGISTGLIVGLAHFRRIWQALALICSTSLGIEVCFLVGRNMGLVYGLVVGLIIFLGGSFLYGGPSTNFQTIKVDDGFYISIAPFDDPYFFFEPLPDFFKYHRMKILSILMLGPLAFYSWVEYVFIKFHLALFGPIPWNYQRLLDYAVECILLRKIGDDYIFTHRLLLEYFASLDTKPLNDHTNKHKKTS